MLDIIAKPFGVLLLWLYNLVGNYGVAIFLFALVVKLIMVPFQFKSQKGMMRMQLLNPQIQELQKRHEGNQQRLQQEIANLYREEKVNPMSGCLWMLIPYPILLALYRAVRFPLTTMMGVPAELLSEGGSIFNKLTELGFTASSGSSVNYLQLEQSEFISNHFAAFQGLSERLVNINYNFLGLNLAHTPSLRFWLTEDWTNGNYWQAVGLFLIPIVSAGLSWVQMKVSQATNPTAANNPQQAQQQQSMKMMNLMMPLMSLWIGFSMPATMGMYWVFNSVLYIIQSLIMNRYFAKMLAEEMAVREAKNREKQAEIERKRQETERLKAEGLIKENTSTSKKKQQARQKAEMDELRAAAIREERAAKRARMGLPEKAEEEIPPSQVGNRRYARGRAYVPDRYTNPEGAEAATAAAAARSEAEEAAGLGSETDADETPAAAGTEAAGAALPVAGQAQAEDGGVSDEGDADSDREDADSDEDTEYEEDPSQEDKDL